MDPKKTMEEINPHPFNHDWIILHRYEWDCMATAIFYGRVEMITILEGFGMEKWVNPNNIEAGILSFTS